ncbi:MAG: hypothetical protein B7Y88_13750 [Sphingomonadales bacterium 32-64-17]|nr:MAG: hypothetical protein B7Y88_13750 [Sphingomonadales bacterium 32-64-17]
MIAARLFPHVSLVTIEREVKREFGHRRKLYAYKVDRGSMLAEVADRELALASAWGEDLARMIAALDQPGAPAPAGHGFSWHERRGAVLRELDLRDRLYPKWIADGRVIERDAAHQVACLQCLLELYEDGFDFTGFNGARPKLVGTRTPEQVAASVDFFQLQYGRSLRIKSPMLEAIARKALATDGAEPDAVGEQKEMAL